MNVKYWLVAKIASWCLKFFAKRNDSDITDNIVKFVDITLDTTKPTNFKVIEYIDKSLEKEGEE